MCQSAAQTKTVKGLNAHIAEVHTMITVTTTVAKRVFVRNVAKSESEDRVVNVIVVAIVAVVFFEPSWIFLVPQLIAAYFQWRLQPKSASYPSWEEPSSQEWSIHGLSTIDWVSLLHQWYSSTSSPNEGAEVISDQRVPSPWNKSTTSERFTSWTHLNGIDASRSMQ